MAREVTLFTDDGQWSAVVTAWEVDLGLYHDLGVRVRVYRLDVPGTWGTERGPWVQRGPWSGYVRGPWGSRGPWGGAWGPWRADGPWARGPWWPHDRRDGGPWGYAQQRSWVENPADSIEIDVRFLDAAGGEVSRRVVMQKEASFLRVAEGGFGGALELPDSKGAPARVESLRGAVTVVVRGVTIRGEVSTRPASTR